MNPSDVADVLTAAGVYDGRTISQIDVAAWHAVIGQYDRADGLAAVVRHYAESTDWMKPAHLVKHIVAIRNERATAKHSEVRALPSRFEDDPHRDARLDQGMARLAKLWSVPDADSDDPLTKARQRAKRERGKRQPIPARVKRRDAKPIDLDKVKGPDWATAEAREREAVVLLHRADRPCGRGVCTREGCQRARTA